MPSRCRCLPRALAIFFVVALGLGGQAAFAQTLPGSLLKATGSLSSAQKQTIQKFAAPLLKQLSNGDAGQVVTARSQLLKPLTNASASSDFRSAYSQAIASSLSKDVTNSRLIVRLNAMILISNLTDGPILSAAKQAIKDKSPAVRYWGAKTLGKYASKTGHTLSQANRQQIQQLLKNEVGNEESTAVLQQVFLAMASLGKNGNHQSLFNALTSRLAFHQQHPKTSFLAEQTAMQAVYVQLVTDSTNNKPVKGQLNKLAAIAVRYYALAANQLQNDKKLSDAQKNQRVKLATFCDQMLRFALKTEGGTSGNGPQNIQSAVSVKNWQAVSNIAQSWQQLLQQSPFNLSKEQVAISP